VEAALLVQIMIAVGTWALALITWWLVRRQLSTAKEQLKVQLYLEVRKEIDGGRLTSSRKRLAQQLLQDPSRHDVQEDVMNFFEDMGMLFRRDYLDREMIWDTFGYYARMWWSACRNYIADERARHSRDETFFSDFEFLVERICEDDANRLKKARANLEPSQSDIKAFLDGEAQLHVDPPAISSTPFS
jgi:hypothetical protein